MDFNAQITSPKELMAYIQTHHPLTLFLIFLFIVIPSLLYFRTLQRTMNTVDPSLRPFHPALIWFALLPFIGMFWYPIYIIMLSLSIKKELVRRQLLGNGALGLAIAIIILFLIFLLMPVSSQFILYLSGLHLVLWILYWIKMASYHKRLAQPYLLVD